MSALSVLPRQKGADTAASPEADAVEAEKQRAFSSAWVHNFAVESKDVKRMFFTTMMEKNASGSRQQQGSAGQSYSGCVQTAQTANTKATLKLGKPMEARFRCV